MSKKEVCNGRVFTLDDEMLKAIENFLEWLRNNEVDVDNANFPTVKALSKLVDIPMPKKMDPKNKKRTINSVLE